MWESGRILVTITKERGLRCSPDGKGAEPRWEGGVSKRERRQDACEGRAGTQTACARGAPSAAARWGRSPALTQGQPCSPGTAVLHRPGTGPLTY